MKMGPCEDPSEVLHEAALGQDSLTAFVQRHDSEPPSCLKAGLELTWVTAAPHEMQNGFGELLCDETAGCLSYDYMERAAANDRDCLVGECANVALPILGKVLHDEFEASRGCLNESRIEIGNCRLKNEGLCMEKSGIQGEDRLVISIETRETSATHLKRNCVEAKEQKDDNGVNGPSSKGLVEEKGDSLAVIESNTRDHLSAYCEMPVEHQSAGPSHCPEQDCLEDDKLVNCTFTKRILKLIEEEHDALVGTETLSCNESGSPEGFEMPSESMFAGYSPKKHIQLDVHKCCKSMGSPYVEGFMRVSEERSGVLVGADSLSCKPILPSEGAEVSTTCLDAKSIQQGEQKDDKSIDCPSVEGTMEFKEVMIFNEQILPSYCCEILSESMPVTISLKNCDGENVLDTRTFRGLDSNTDMSYQIEAHSCKQIFLPEGDELPIKSLEGDLQSSGWHDNQKSETGDSGPYTERSEKAVEIKSCAKTCVTVLSPQYEQSDGKDVSGPSAESNSKLLEEKNDSKADVKLELCSQLSFIGQNAFNSEKGFFGMAANCLVERPTYLQLTGCPGVVEHSSFMSLDVKDCLRRSVFGAIDSVSAVGSSGQEDNKQISIFKVDHVSEVKISKNVSLSSPRTNRTRRSSQKSKGKKAARKCRDAAKVPHQHEILEYILKSPKRKRSHFSRVARCALWGSMGNIAQHFKQSNGLGLDYVLNQESLKSLGGQESGMRNKSGKGRSSRRSSKKSSASTRVLRLKVKVGSENCHQSNVENVISEILDTSASAEANINNSGSDCCPGGSNEPSKSANGIKDEWAEEASEKQLFSVDKYVENAKTELDVDFHGANCDCTVVPEELGRDGANLGFASHVVNEALGGTIDRTFADPGTSPDSEVINIVPDAEVVTKPEEELNGSSYCGAVTHNKKGKKKGNLPFVLNQESLKSLGGRESGMRNKSGKGGSSRRSSRKSSASTSVLRLKVEVGSENCHQNYLTNVIPEVLDTSASVGTKINNSGSDSCLGGSIEPSKSANGIKDEWGEEVSEKLLFSVDKYTENAKTELDVDSHGPNCECSLVPDKLGREGANLGFASHMVVEALGGTIVRTFADPGTSPNSEVTNVVPDAEVVTKPEEELNGSSYCGAFARNKKGEQKGDLPYVCADIIKSARPLKNGGGKHKLGDRMSPSESLTSSTLGTASSISSSSRDMELLSLPRETEFEVPEENLEVKICVEDEKCRDIEGYLGLSESENSISMLYSAISERVQAAKSSKPEGLSMERSKVSDLAKSREGSASRKRGSKQKLINKGKVKEKTTHDHAANRVAGYPESGKHMEVVIGGDNVVSINNLDMTSGSVIEQSLPVESAWVHCDDCHKWRRISDALLNSIDESSPWSCKDNMDKAFADCSIPQEKSNADINAELGISDADEDIYDSHLNQKWSEYKCITVSQESSFKRIDANEFPHRSRKNQTIDEIMVCHCKPTQDGWLGCGDQCLNRMLNIECVQGTCPCGDICSNQQFQKRQYAGMKWVRCGKKGFGLQLQEDISKGQFLIEYVGEVLDMHAYEARQREYAAKGHKHFYFMTLNGGEVIDACGKGNLGRFINHSCDPNCRTEKWMVNGEICIGLFALKDIKKGEEVTFDYNYVRVFGAAVKKCHCGSPQCRGYIGGETHNAEIIVQGDSDEEFPEPVMLEGGKTGVHLKDMRRRTNSSDNEDMKSVEVPVLKSEMRMTTEIGDAINLSASATSQPHSSPELEASKRKSLCYSQPEVSPQTVSASKSTSCVKVAIPPENTLCSVQVLEKSFYVDVDASRKSKSETVKGKRVFSKSRFLIKTSHGSLKKGKINGNLPNENKVQMISNKPLVSVRPKRVVEGSSDGRFEAVEEKLNELLDANGGISKRKEAPKVYLKLLLLTAASGGSGNGEAIQSNRDLSMILDALLKTKSRVVLLDIINKNGLRMLHNIMKQYRRDFKKIPILRKLLKVLEYLATREILAFDHINGGPPCPGMESFMESMLSLTEHDDKQVHQSARHFRDRWIPKFVRKANCLDRDDGGMEFHRGSSCGKVSVISHNNRRDGAVRSAKAIDYVMQSVPVTTLVDVTVQEGSSVPSAGGYKTNGAKTRKRKSRWDQPAEPKTNLGSSISPNKGRVDHLEVVSREDGSCLEYIHNQCQENETICATNRGINSPEDVPPGFSSPLNPTQVSLSTSITPRIVGCLSCPLEVVVGNSQGKFISHLPVSYGIPLPIVQQIGSSDNATRENWVIAPGMPFHPFPPLPPYPRDTKSTPHCTVKSMATNEHAQKVLKDGLDNTGCYPHESNHSKSFSHQSKANIQLSNIQQTSKRARGSSYDLGKKYDGQKKWNKVPPWVRRSMDWGYAGNNL